MLGSLGGVEMDGVLVGLDAPDDAAVYSLEGGQAIVSTVDFFTPIVDDPYFFGAIAAANSLSDIYAMGGRPLFALNIVAFPVGELDHSILAQILRGGRDKAREANVAIVGGHSVDDKEPKYGMAVVGVLRSDRIYRRGDGRPGDRLILSKPIGTGIISTAIKAGTASDDVVTAATESMVRLNGDALERALHHDTGAITDVTGFGLLGHLGELARLSGRAATIDSRAVPLLPDAWKLADAGSVPGGTRRNRTFIETSTRWHENLNDTDKILLCDAQTSGGLLLSVAAEESESLVSELKSAGYPAAADIGELVAGTAGAIEVR